MLEVSVAVGTLTLLLVLGGGGVYLTALKRDRDEAVTALMHTESELARVSSLLAQATAALAARKATDEQLAKQLDKALRHRRSSGGPGP